MQKFFKVNIDLEMLPSRCGQRNTKENRRNKRMQKKNRSKHITLLSKTIVQRCTSHKLKMTNVQNECVYIILVEPKNHNGNGGK